MKMKKLFLTSLLFAFTFSLMGCGNNQPTVEPDPTPGGSEPEVGKVVVTFYADYNQINQKNVYHVTKVNKGDKLVAPNAPSQSNYEEFPTFLGWSIKQVIDSRDDLWDFANDRVDIEELTLNMFGIWVAEGEW